MKNDDEQKEKNIENPIPPRDVKGTKLSSKSIQEKQLSI